ncbi:hypothetical protein [Actinacidiphila oryziradicis]|uniref:hypothetical protein n=1 Tax=Actinacidiphila oryziradicis TaxID=2571141 RepID=UPI0023F41E88|nr:hypothetical protein [Actinacidiphila oryziradicis]MCW2872100.1 hypothetical protein [Actinacidiphila oryziradicis]
MGYTVLYIAFGGVALWLLGEVLLQYKARLRWRLLAFGGFVGVVLGVYLPSVIVIALGAAAFGTGQTFVTLSYRRGFTSGWAIRSGADKPGKDEQPDRSGKSEKPAGGNRRRRGRGEEAEAQPPFQVSPVEPIAAGVGAGAATGSGLGAAEDYQAYENYGTSYENASYEGIDSTQVYQPMPLVDESGEYPIYNNQSSYTPDPYTSGGYEGYGAQGYNGWNGEQQQPAAPVYDQQQGAWDSQQGYQPASDPYLGYGYSDPNQAQPQSQYSYDTPAGGVWVPQQQSGDEQQPYIPQQPQYEPNQQAQQAQQPQYEQQYVDPSDPYRF